MINQASMGLERHLWRKYQHMYVTLDTRLPVANRCRSNETTIHNLPCLKLLSPPKLRQISYHILLLDWMQIVLCKQLKHAVKKRLWWRSNQENKPTDSSFTTLTVVNQKSGSTCKSTIFRKRKRTLKYLQTRNASFVKTTGWLKIMASLEPSLIKTTTFYLELHSAS